MSPRSPRSLAALGTTLALATSGAVIALAPAAHAEPAAPTADCAAVSACTTTYGYTGAPETFTVPSGISHVTASVTGASGGAGSGAGKGGVTTAVLAVSPGDVLTVVVGQQGSKGDTTGTYGGGGPVTDAATGSTSSSGGGGSYVFSGADLQLAAGGGGGTTGASDYGNGPIWGGSGGGGTGGDGEGYPDPGFYFYTGATGGSQSAGGAGGTFSLGFPGNSYGTTAGTSGDGPATAPDAFGHGGTGGHDTHTDNVYREGGGGGGGGYYGGGAGGFYQSGGGGSGFVAPGAASTATSGVKDAAGPGSVTFTWDIPATRTNPRVTARFSSPSARSARGWYRGPVTVRFTCSSTSAPVVACPRPMTFLRNDAQTVFRTVRSEDGGVTTKKIVVKIDRTAPRVRIRGARAGRTYDRVPSVRCLAVDKPRFTRSSGLARPCSLTRTIRATGKPQVRRVTWTAVATDGAGNLTRRTKSVRVRG